MPDPIDIGVGARMRVRRKELGVSQSALAQHLGLTFQQVQKYERGANRVSASMLVKIAERLDCSVAFMVGEEPGSRGDLSGGLLARLAEPGVADLVEAFHAIESPQIRSALLRLARSMSEDDAAAA
ncbi:MAG: helix-turn-helix transcriptional regulator [Pseudomonadota bacterium]